MDDNSGAVNIIRTAYYAYIHGPELMKLIFAVLWALHVIRRIVFFTFILIITAVHLKN